METTTPTWRMVLLPIGFVVVCVALSITIWTSFGGSVPLQAQSYRFTTVLPRADAISDRASVRISGVVVGHVVDVRRSGRRATVSLAIDRDFAPLRRGARVILRTKTLLGEGYIEVAPGPRSAPAIPDGGRLALAAGTPRQQQLDDVLESFPARTRRDLRRMIRGMATAFDGRAQTVNDALGRAQPLVADLSTVATTLDRQGPTLERLIGSAADVFGAFGRQSGAVDAAIAQGETVLRTTAERDRDLRATIDELPPFLRELRSTAGRIATTSPTLNQAVRSLRPTAPLVRPALDSLVRNVPAFERVFRSLGPLLDAGEEGVPAASRVLAEAKPAMGEIHQASREILPIAQLAAVSRDTILGSIANMTSWQNGTQKGPGNKVNGYFTGVLTAWNEIVGGWTKKLPTNRANPYPAPRSAAKVATTGLEAYDCRNENNIGLLPAIGEAPDCRTQQPWTFNGKRTSYPRLLLAPP